jgi:hypothetical protein
MIANSGNSQILLIPVQTNIFLKIIKLFSTAQIDCALAIFLCIVKQKESEH